MICLIVGYTTYVQLRYLSCLSCFLVKVHTVYVLFTALRCFGTIAYNKVELEGSFQSEITYMDVREKR